MIVSKRVLYSGRVQGVGFRYTTRRIAAGFPIVGFVRNLDDGDVEVIAQGGAEHVEAFFAEVAQRMAKYIGSARAEALDPQDFLEFEIRH